MQIFSITALVSHYVEVVDNQFANYQDERNEYESIDQDTYLAQLKFFELRRNPMFLTCESNEEEMQQLLRTLRDGLFKSDRLITAFEDLVAKIDELSFKVDALLTDPRVAKTAEEIRSATDAKSGLLMHRERICARIERYKDRRSWDSQHCIGLIKLISTHGSAVKEIREEREGVQVHML